MGAGLAVTCDDGPRTLSYFNDNLCELLGYTRAGFFEFCNGTMNGVIAQEDVVRVSQQMRLELAEKKQYKCEYRMVQADGQRIWVLDSGRQFTDNSGGAHINCVITDISQLKEAMEELRRRAEYDELTGICNKRTFYLKTRKMLDEDTKQRYAIMRTDISRFKVINDMLGFAVGDEIICHFASIYKELFSGKGTYTRLESDHFAACFPCDGIDFAQLTRYFIERVHSLDIAYEVIPYFGFYVIEDPKLPVDLMCDRALLALYTVKGNYILRYAEYDDKLRNSIIEEQQIVNDMSLSLERGEFDIYMQPIFNHVSGAIVGAEALARWQHPTRGMISPSIFIPIFEKNGYISKLDEYIWTLACRWLAGWMRDGNNLVPISVSVNVSRVDIYNPELCEVLIRLIEEYQLPASMFRLEITESAYIENPDQLIEMVKKLKSHGFTIEMDDFGSGYSSLNTLKDVPVDILKLDMKFLSGRDYTGRGGSILSSVVRMAKWLGIPVIAEGVETQNQADYLKSIGCEFVQGYLYSQPLPLDEFEKLLNSSQTEPAKSIIFSGDDIDANELWDPNAPSTLLFNSISDAAGIFEYWNGVAEALRVNDRYFTELCTTRERYNVYRSHIIDSIAPECRENFFDMIRRAVDTKADAESDTCWLRSDGSVRLWLRVRVRVLACSADRYIFYVSIKNTTDHMQARELLAATAKINAMLMKTSNEPYAVFDYDVARDQMTVRDVIGDELRERVICDCTVVSFADNVKRAHFSEEFMNIIRSANSAERAEAICCAEVSVADGFKLCRVKCEPLLSCGKRVTHIVGTIVPDK